MDLVKVEKSKKKKRRENKTKDVHVYFFFNSIFKMATIVGVHDSGQQKRNM